MEGGESIVYYYMKLMLLSVETFGMLRISNELPYYDENLSIVTNTEIDLVMRANEILYDMDMIFRLADDTLFIPEAFENVGSETESAKRMRKHRGKMEMGDILTEIASHCDLNVHELTLQHFQEYFVESESQSDVASHCYKRREEKRREEKRKEEKNKKNNSDLIIFPDNNRKDVKAKIENALEIERKKGILKLSESLWDGIIKNVNPPTFKNKNKKITVDKWYSDIEKLNRIDGMSESDIDNVISWAVKDSFWQNNILSGLKLRKHYDKLYIQMGKSNKDNFTNISNKKSLPKLEDI
jgi:hypothetical protein